MKYDVFISYRREGGYDTAKHLNDLLVRDGYKVSFDIDTLRSGDFDIQLLERIDQCKDFILVVDQHCFDRTLDPNFDPKKDWLRCELEYALERDKNIIPVFLSGVTSFPDNLPGNLQNVVMKNGPEFNRYHFNSFYDILKERFLHKQPVYRQKKYVISFFVLILLTLSTVLLSLKGKSNDNIVQEKRDVEEIIPDYKSLITKKYENTPDDATERMDIVEVIKTFLENTDSETCQTWGVFSKFIKNHQIVPLSQGIEEEGDSAIFPYRLDFISKLVYKGKNLDTDIHGQSRLQEIYLGGPRMGPLLMVITSHGYPTELGEWSNDIIKDSGFDFQKHIKYTDYSTNYYIYRNSEGCLLVETVDGGSGGDWYEWIISYSQDVIIEYLDKDFGGINLFKIDGLGV